MKRYQFLILTALAFCIPPAASRADWVQEGGPLNVDIGQHALASTLASNGTTVCAVWMETNGTNNQVYVKHFNGTAWVQDGASLNVDTAHDASRPKLGWEGTQPYVAWMENVGTNWQVYVKHYNGNAWIQDGAVLNIDPGHNAENPSLAVQAGTPYVSWEEFNGAANQIYVKHFNGAAWVQDGAALNVNSANSACNSSIAFDGTTPYVAWVENNGVNIWLLYVKHFNGTDWVQDGAALNVNSAISASAPKLACNGGTPYVVFYESNGTSYQVYVKHYNGAAWIQDGAALNVNSAYSAQSPSLAFIGAVPYVAWNEDEGTHDVIYAKYHNGAAWVQEGASINVDPAHIGRSPNLISHGDVPYISWQEYNGAVWRIYVKHYAPPAPTVTATATVIPTGTPTRTVTSTPHATFTPQANAHRDGVYVIPNPFIPTQIGRARFCFPSAAPGAAYTIRILNLRGRLMRTLRNEADWDGRDDAGNRCEGGVYVYQIEAEGRRYSGTIALLGK